ncbi:hypothetical protein HRbin02_01669 [Candidatus Calditenuaceae archaeon HR02]|nr:hypothetical protein HRbin02_01669 [Candidatus Calditenuaceae archaeon HR02]
MSRVRLRLAGGISFASQLIGHLFGILFAGLVSRRLTEREFGAWAYIGTILGYPVALTDLFSTWVYRDAAYGRRILGHVLLLNTPILLAASLIYYAASGPASSLAGIERDIFLLGLAVLPPLYLATAVTDMAKGYIPQHVGLASILFETAKLALGIMLVAHLRLELAGVFTALALAYTLQLGFLLFSVKPLYSSQIDSATIKRWLRGSVIKLITVVSGYLSQLDIILLTAITAETLATGYWQAALLVALMVKSTGSLTSGLTQRLLSGGGRRDLEKSFNFTMTLAAPATLGAIILAGDILHAFRPAYSEAWPAATLLALSAFTATLTSFYSSTVFASDRFDLKEDVTIGDMARSRVSLLWRIGLYTSAAYAATSAAALLLIRSVGGGVIETITAVAVVHLAVNVARLLIHRRLAARYSPYLLSLSSGVPYLSAATSMSIVVYAARSLIDPRAPTLAQTIPPLLALLGIGAASYFTILWFMSKQFRELLRDIVTFLKQYLGR